MDDLVHMFPYKKQGRGPGYQHAHISKPQAPMKLLQTVVEGESKEAEKEQQRQRMLKRSQSAVELRSVPLSITRHGSTGDLRKQPFSVELTNPEGQTYIAGRLSNEERAQKILR